MKRNTFRKLSQNSFSYVLFVLLLIISIVFLWFFFTSRNIAQQQQALQPFYNTAALPQGKPGTLIRHEPMDRIVPFGKAYRILYQSERADGTPTISSGMLFIPSHDPPHDGRDIVAWAHGTIGMGERCAPSRSMTPLSAIGGLSELLQAGYIVTATDYAGLGTAGTERYLIGTDEARDVLNSVRAARQFPQTQSTNRFALWGHSQGGHSVLFAANQAKIYAPELELVAAAAAAPATELPLLMQQAYKTAVPWVIGPEIVVSWQRIYDLPLEGVLSPAAINNYERLARECTSVSALEAILRNKFGEWFFESDPNANPIWKNALKEQTPLPVVETPLFITQGLSDTIVLPNTTALYAKKSCDAGTNLTLQWLPQVTHVETANVAGPKVASWIEQRFAGLPTENTCTQDMPVTPAMEPK